MMIKRVTTKNNAYQHLEVLKRNRTRRTKYGEMVIEGVLPIKTALESGIEPVRIYFEDIRRLSNWAKELVESHPAAECYALSPELMAEISEKDQTSEIIITAPQPRYDPSHIRMERTVLLDRPSSPGNLGSIVRTCDSLGLDAVLISGHGVDPYDPKCISASRGTVFSTPVLKAASNDEIISLLDRLREAAPFRVFGSSASGTTEIYSLDPPDRFMLVVGNETTGMGPFFRDLVDETIVIPMTGRATSLNIACATSILLYELTRPRSGA